MITPYSRGRGNDEVSVQLWLPPTVIRGPELEKALTLAIKIQSMSCLVHVHVEDNDATRILMCGRFDGATGCQILEDRG